MLGLRLEAELAARLERFATSAKRTRSDVARSAVREYLDRHSLDAEFVGQARALDEELSRDRIAEIGRGSSEWLNALDAEDGGYDWGPNGPPA